MNGADLAKVILSINPQLKCLFMSGYTADAISRHGVLDEKVHFIQKPFSLFAIASKLREVLDGKWTYYYWAGSWFWVKRGGRFNLREGRSWYSEGRSSCQEGCWLCRDGRFSFTFQPSLFILRSLIFLIAKEFMKTSRIRNFSIIAHIDHGNYTEERRTMIESMTLDDIFSAVIGAEANQIWVLFFFKIEDVIAKLSFL